MNSLQIRYQLVLVINGKEYPGNYYKTPQEAQIKCEEWTDVDRAVGEYRTTYKVQKVQIDLSTF